MRSLLLFPENNIYPICYWIYHRWFQHRPRSCLRNFICEGDVESTMEVLLHIAMLGCGVFRTEWWLETSVACMNFQTEILSQSEIILPYNSIEYDHSSTTSRSYDDFRKLNSPRKFVSLRASRLEISNWFDVWIN
jgi:hypothetical protein